MTSSESQSTKLSHDSTNDYKNRSMSLYVRRSMQRHSDRVELTKLLTSLMIKFLQFSYGRLTILVAVIVS